MRNLYLTKPGFLLVAGDLMYLNAGTGSVEIIDNLSQPADVSAYLYSENNRPLVTSSWLVCQVDNLNKCIFKDRL